jgi:ferredoxin-NADP reductase
VELERLRVRAGQSLHWRFLARGHWWETHPFSLSAAPDGRRLRITVKDVGDYTRRLASMPVGTRVIIEGPSGGLTSAARRHPRVALIAGGVGIAPIRALLEDTPGEPGTIAVIYRAACEDDVLFRDELDDLAQRRGAELHYVLGERRGDELLSAEHLQALVPDIASRDVYVCGPPRMAEATRTSLRRAGVPRRHIVSEGFGW